MFCVSIITVNQMSTSLAEDTTITRINTCPVEELSNPHLKGEYKEISRVFTSTIKCINRHGLKKAYRYIKNKQPSAYTVQTKDNPKGGQGHEMFFRDKLKYIEDRYLDLTTEMQRRGYSPNEDMVLSVIDNAHKVVVDKRYWNDYIPTPEAYELNKKRRIEMS